MTLRMFSMSGGKTTEKADFIEEKNGLRTSRLRKLYFLKLFARILIFFSCIYVYLKHPQMLQILYGFHFFKRLSPFHILWLIWVFDMGLQLIPGAYRSISLGSKKLYKIEYRPAADQIDYPALKKYVITSTRSAYKVFLLWVGLTVGIGILYFTRIIDSNMIFLITAFFYVCDLICVVIWCPFRLIVGNRCCTTCRIFNWDHFMMFAPMAYIYGFYGWSLLLMAVAVWLIWELSFMMYPERFWQMTNRALRCSQCTDKLCTQYCRKRRGV